MPEYFRPEFLSLTMLCKEIVLDPCMHYSRLSLSLSRVSSSQCEYCIVRACMCVYVCFCLCCNLDFKIALFIFMGGERV